MKASTRQLEAVRETSEEQKNRADVAHILEEDEIKQIYRDRSAEDALDEAEDNEAAVEEEVDELEEEDDVVRAAQGSRNLTP
jgi:tripartite-type tricarboxylate transporter receptor subunit TctC